MKNILLFCLHFILIILFLSLPGCSKQKKQINAESYVKEIEQWRKDRVTNITSETGWLTLCGLFWLKEGENKFGSDSANHIIFPAGKSPGYAGSIFCNGENLQLKVKRGVDVKYNDSLIVSMKIFSDENGNRRPMMFNLNTLTFWVIKRGDKVGIRVRDKNNPSRLQFKGLDYFPPEIKWRIDAKYEPYNPPKIIPIVNVLNQVTDDTCPGAVAFEIERIKYHLDALRETKQLFIIFSDETSDKETYGMGRFLYTGLPDSVNNVVIDFNKAYNPPCAFTDYATCPRPPKQNQLPVRIEAGEKKYKGSSH